jgi:hypothetical protein
MCRRLGSTRGWGDPTKSNRRGRNAELVARVERDCVLPPVKSDSIGGASQPLTSVCCTVTRSAVTHIKNGHICKLKATPEIAGRHAASGVDGDCRGGVFVDRKQDHRHLV